MPNPSTEDWVQFVLDAAAVVDDAFAVDETWKWVGDDCGALAPAME